MKRLLKIGAGVVVGILILLLVLPMLFKGKVEAFVKKEINKNLKAKVEYNDLSLSLLKGFPNVQVGLSGLSIVGEDKFSGDTLLVLNNFSTEVGLIGAFSGQVEVKSVLLDGLRLNAIMLEDSTTNWDIMATKEEDFATVSDDAPSGESSDYKIVLRLFEVRDAHISYLDKVSNLQAEVEGVQLQMSGDLSEKLTNIALALNVDDVMLEYDNVKYVNGIKLGWDAEIGADLEKMDFTMLDNEMRINKMAAELVGSFAVKEKSYGMDLHLATKNTDFKSLLALVPEVYLKDYESLRTDGQLKLEAEVVGEYIDENHIPSFNLMLEVTDGLIQYPDLPKCIENIDVKLVASNPGGSPDSTVTSLETFHFDLGGNPFDASLLITKPVSNLTFNGKVNGKVDLASFQDAVPLDSVKVGGVVEAHLTFDGNNALIKSGEYNKIRSNGSVVLDKVYYSAKDIAYDVTVKEAEMQFTPQALELKKFQSKVGESDFDLKGQLENYLSYVLGDGVLKGKLVHRSDYINTNQFMADAEPVSDTVKVVVDEETDLAVVEVPKNLDLELSSQIGHLVYDKLDVTNAEGKIVVKDGAVVLDGLDMNTLGGSLTMTGQYNTANIEQPFVDFSFSGQNIDINKAANSFSIVDSMLPIAKHAAGVVSPNFKYHSLIAEDFKPIITTVDGGGNIKSSSVEVSGTKIQNGIAAMMKNERYKTIKAQNFDIHFQIDKGNVIIEPFTTTVEGKVIEVEGRQGVDQSIDYRITLPIERKELAGLSGMASLMGIALPTTGDVMVDVIVKGTVQDPKLSLNLDKATSEVGQDLEKEAKNAVDKFLSDPDSQKKIEEFGKKLKNIFK